MRKEKRKEKTKNNTGLSLVLALSYSSHSEIVRAVKNIAAEVSNKNIEIEIVRIIKVQYLVIC